MVSLMMRQGDEDVTSGNGMTTAALHSKSRLPWLRSGDLPSSGPKSGLFFLLSPSLWVRSVFVTWMGEGNPFLSVSSTLRHTLSSGDQRNGSLLQEDEALSSLPYDSLPCSAASYNAHIIYSRATYIMATCTYRL